jgi:hypothetical protein
LAAAVLVLAAALLAGCAPKQIALHYAPEGLPPLRGAGSVTVFQFDDRRGSEGDADPYRVGGIYGRYGNRQAKIMVSTPFARTLAEALAAGFRARGVEAQAADRPYRPGSTPVSTAFALAGEVHNFSTEARFTNSAHVSGIVRLYAKDGGLLIEKEVSERDTFGPEIILRRLTPASWLESALNDALAKFVASAVTDRDIASRIAP